jgi:predicted choloylglycine hydrolase
MNRFSPVHFPVKGCGYLLTAGGTPNQIGNDIGSRFKTGILHNVEKLLHTEKVERYKQNIQFIQWLNRQERLLDGNWPWLMEEVSAIANAAGAPYEEILMLNLRAWQYDIYGDEGNHNRKENACNCCSSLAIMLSDNTKACAGTLDDPAQYYCGPVKYIPENGYSFITFPITGTVWGNRGMNSAGLSLGISSQCLSGIQSLNHAINQDMALRVILQTCATAEDVRRFCKMHPFCMNLVCVDANGCIFCAHHTSAGLYEIPAADYAALTNHVSDDRCAYWLKRKGVSGFLESPTTRARRGNLLEFIQGCNGRCSLEEVMGFIGKRDDSDPGSLHNKESIYATCSNPERYPNTIWIMDCTDTAMKDYEGFVKYTL